MIRKKELVFCVMPVLLLIMIATIAAQTNDANSKELNFAIGNIKCRTDFSIGVINIMNTMVSSDALLNATAILSSDYSQLKAYSNSYDKESFRNYTKNTYDADLKLASSTVQNWRRTYQKNLTLEQKTSLKDSYAVLKTTYDTCHFTTLKEYGTGRINAFNSILDSYQKRIDTLNSKGINTTSLQQVIDDAKTQIIQPMQDVLANGTDEKSIRQALLKYCMFDGCNNGINFHLAAKFEIAKLDIALAKIKSNSNVTAVSDNVTLLETDISNAKTALTIIGTTKYNKGKQLWDNIKAGYQIIKEISKIFGGNS